MAKKSAEPTERYVTAPTTRTIHAKKPVAHDVLVVAGTSFRVVPDGPGRPIDDVSRTVWESYAAEVEAPESTDKNALAEA